MSQLTDELVRKFSRLFRCRENTYGRYTPDPGGDPEKKIVATVNGAVPDGMWRAHLEGELPFLGSCPIMQDNTCYWGAIDYDDDAVDHVDLEARIRASGVPLVLCRSRSGAAHLFVFFSEPIGAKLVIAKLKEWRTVLGVAKNPDGRDVEVFPKQDNLKPSQQGNWVNLPYWDWQNTNRYAIHEGRTLSLEEFLLLAENKRVSEASLKAVRPNKLKGVSNSETMNADDPFVDGPPCLQTLHKDGWTEGSRNASLFNIALFLRLMYPDDWQEEVAEFNKRHFNPPLADGEVELLVGSLERHPDYVYRCGDAPIESVCEKVKCKKRTYGIKAFTDKFIEQMMPELSGLVKVMTDPPLWILQVNSKPVEFSTDDLLMLQRFRKVVLEKMSIIVPNVSQPIWDGKLRTLLETHTTQEAPDDAGVIGEFRHLTAAFLILRKSARKREDILLGKPFQEGDQIYFRSTDFTAFLRRKGFREYTTNKIFSILKGMGASHGQLKIAGAVARVWIMPVPENEQSQDFAAPKSARPNF